MTKFKIIEEGRISNNEMGKILGGDCMPGNYGCRPIYEVKPCALLATCGDGSNGGLYLSCSGPEQGNYLICGGRDIIYNGVPGPGGLTHI